MTLRAENPQDLRGCTGQDRKGRLGLEKRAAETMEDQESPQRKPLKIQEPAPANAQRCRREELEPEKNPRA